ncbi:MAG: phage integrase SAM-like domain-containing protein [Pseudomonadota bacterium]|nr:phage integrase SAM-like domain-containing protein [Pseudomonadota bacterium]
MPIEGLPLAAPRPRPIIRAGELTFAEAAAGYLAEVQRDPATKLTEQTRGQNESVYRLFQSFTKDAPLASVDKSQAAGFLDHVARERSLSNKTLNRYTSALSMIWTWADRSCLFFL